MVMAQPHVIYQAKPGSALDVNRDFYARLAPERGKRELVDRFVIPRRSGRAWPVRAGQIFRIVAVEGPQVADLNVWSLSNPRERFWASRIAPAPPGARVDLRSAVVVPALPAADAHDHRRHRAVRPGR